VNLRDVNGDLLADSCSILDCSKNCFCRLLNVHRINEVRQTQMHTTEPLVNKVSCVEVEVAIENLNVYKSPGID
jgi:hypothetical protein